ncbi:DUF4262 domain-containing protein [Archangium violaceum]|uniref:DUF4262 domain-containing protein n=1 Tax=Archangium violaceum TaxID=83451 RepID=UPI00193C3F44|nr:DUF4262 domain-containing protein [Archangium violaceum]QRK08447.1 DUF4262 domain-containing protein [Archangium violaceum]
MVLSWPPKGTDSTLFRRCGGARVVAEDPSLNSLSGMCHGHRTERGSVSQPWTMIDESDEFIARRIRDTGWAVQLIPEDEEEPAFAYMIGLFRNYGHAERILFGL